MRRKKAFIFSEDFFRFDYGPFHPLRMERLQLTYDLITAYGLLDLQNLLLVKPAPAEPREVQKFHRPEYLYFLRQCGRGESWDPAEAESFGLGSGDNPVFSGIWEWSLLAAGSSLQAARLVADGECSLAFNMAGGLHHARAGKASGFCYVNDIVLAIMALRRRGLRVAYVDLDAHHGDGVQDAFYDTDQVLTVSIHQHGRTLFPGGGFVYETGRGQGQGFTVNVPLYPGTDDELYLKVFESLAPDLLKAFEPDVLVTQLGVDTLRTDPLTNLCLTNNGFIRAARILKDLDIPWVALGGGGYHLVNVARAWTLFWAMANDVEVPNELPESFLEKIRSSGYRETRLRDESYCVDKSSWTEANGVARQVVETIRETILPVIARSKRRF